MQTRPSILGHTRASLLIHTAHVNYEPSLEEPRKQEEQAPHQAEQGVEDVALPECPPQVLAGFHGGLPHHLPVSLHCTLTHVLPSVLETPLLWGEGFSGSQCLDHSAQHPQQAPGADCGGEQVLGGHCFLHSPHAGGHTVEPQQSGLGQGDPKGLRQGSVEKYVTLPHQTQQLLVVRNDSLEPDLAVEPVLADHYLEGLPLGPVPHHHQLDVRDAANGGEHFDEEISAPPVGHAAHCDDPDEGVGTHSLVPPEPAYIRHSIRDNPHFRGIYLRPQQQVVPGGPRHADDPVAQGQESLGHPVEVDVQQRSEPVQGVLSHDHPHSQDGTEVHELQPQGGTALVTVHDVDLFFPQDPPCAPEVEHESGIGDHFLFAVVPVEVVDIEPVVVPLPHKLPALGRAILVGHNDHLPHSRVPAQMDGQFLNVDLDTPHEGEVEVRDQGDVYPSGPLLLELSLRD